jgi:excinuclease ABC subunit A
MDKPDVDSIEGLSPAISIEQKSTSKNPRSTVGTVTEIYDYLRLLFARIGVHHCPKCGSSIHPQSAENITSLVMAEKGKTLTFLAPVIRGIKGTHEQVFTPKSAPTKKSTTPTQSKKNLSWFGMRSTGLRQSSTQCQ